MVDRQIIMIAPFAPRAEIVSHARVASEPQREIGIGRAVAALAIGHDFIFGSETERLKFGPQLSSRFKAAVTANVVDPVAMDRAGNRACVPRAHPLAVV